MVSQESQSNKSRKGKTLRNVEIVLGYLTRALVESWSPVSSQGEDFLGGREGGQSRRPERCQHQDRMLSPLSRSSVTCAGASPHGWASTPPAPSLLFHSSFPLCPFEVPALLRSSAKEVSAALGCYGCLGICFVLFHLFHEKRDNHHRISMSLKGLEAT